MPDGAKKTSTLPPFNWMDPLLLGEQLDEDERMTSEAAARFCEQELFPGVLEANRNQTFDRGIYKKMGDAGFLGVGLEGYGCPGGTAVMYGVVARAVEALSLIHI